MKGRMHVIELAKRYTFTISDYVYILFGTFIIAVSFQVFLMPNSIVSGGITGISIIINSLTGWSPAVIQYVFNIPLLIVAYVFLGKEAGNKTILGSLTLPFFISLISHWEPITNDIFLATIIGGLINGLGLGIVYRAKASTGGTSIPIQILNKYTGLSLGTGSLIADGSIVFLSVITFNAEIIMYGLINLYITARAIDMTQVGLNQHKNVLIISQESDHIKRMIMNTIGRGVTNIGIRGGLGDETRDMLMCVIPEREFPYLKEMILSYDEEAFVVVMSASEVMGRGFSLANKFEAYGNTHFVEEYVNQEN